MRRSLALFALALAAVSCRPVDAPRAVGSPVAATGAYSYDVLNAHLWQQTAEEYRGLSLQAFALAELALERALADSSWTAAPEQMRSESASGLAALPPAIIVDVDETVLDNSPYATRLIRDRARTTSERWSRWVEERRAVALPGAAEFLRLAAARGVTTFYVTNRDAELQEATRENLRAEGFPLRDDIETVLTRGLREEWAASDKGPRRRFVAERFRVVLMMGDDLNDFHADTRGTPAERQAATAPYLGFWGSRWILLPNPVYGSWEGALLGHERGLAEAEILRRKLAAMRDTP